jgi:site-specific recombinase XerD
MLPFLCPAALVIIIFSFLGDILLFDRILGLAHFPLFLYPCHNLWGIPCNLNVGDIELKEKSGSLHIRKGKGLRERRTAVPLPARKALQQWLDLRAELGIGNDKEQVLFVRLRGKPGERLSVRAVQDMVSEATRRAGIEEAAVTPHVLRHTCAFMLRTAGADIETRAKMLGHSVKTASKYGAPGNSEIEKAAALLDHAEAA